MSHYREHGLKKRKSRYQLLASDFRFPKRATGEENVPQPLILFACLHLRVGNLMLSFM